MKIAFPLLALLMLSASAGATSVVAPPSGSVESTGPSPCVAEASGMVVATVPGPVQDVGPGLVGAKSQSVEDYMGLHCEAVDGLGVSRMSSGACGLPTRNDR